MTDFVLWKEVGKFSGFPHGVVGEPEQACGGRTLGSAPPDSSWSYPGRWGFSVLGQQLFLPGH